MSTSSGCRGPESVAARATRAQESRCNHHAMKLLARGDISPSAVRLSPSAVPELAFEIPARFGVRSDTKCHGCVGSVRLVLAGRKVIRSAHEEGGWLRNSLKCPFTTEVSAAGMRARCLLTQESQVAHTSRSRAGRPCVCLAGRDWNAPFRVPTGPHVAPGLARARGAREHAGRPCRWSREGPTMRGWRT